MAVRIYSYTRFSCHKSKNGDSKRRQEAFIAGVVLQEKGVLDESRTFHDEACSAHHSRNAEDGKLGAFLALVDQGLVPAGSVLAIEMLDRLSRDMVGIHLRLFLRILAAGVVIVTAEPYRRYTLESCNDLSHILDAIIRMQVAWEHSNKLKVRIKEVWSARRTRQQEGEREHFGPLPAWLRWVDGVMEPIPERVETIGAIFRFAREGLGARRIVRKLADKPDVYPPFIEGKKWCESYVRSILKSGAVLGEQQPKLRDPEKGREKAGPAVPDHYPRVIEQPLWDAAHKTMRARSGKGGRPGFKERSLLSGLVWFAANRQKGAIAHSNADGKNYIYLTAERSGSGSKKANGGLAVRYAPFEAFVRDYLGELKDNPNLLDQGGENLIEARIASVTSDLIEADTTLSWLTQEVGKPGVKHAKVLSLNQQIDQIIVEKERLSAELQELQADQGSNRPELIGEVSGLVQGLALASDADLARMRRQLKARLCEILESVWVLVQPVSRQTKIVHVQFNFRWGQTDTVVMMPGDNCRAEPWDMSGVDLREYRSS